MYMVDVDLCRLKHGCEPGSRPMNAPSPHTAQLSLVGWKRDSYEAHCRVCSPSHQKGKCLPYDEYHCVGLPIKSLHWALVVGEDAVACRHDHMGRLLRSSVASDAHPKHREWVRTLKVEQGTSAETKPESDCCRRHNDVQGDPRAWLLIGGYPEIPLGQPCSQRLQELRFGGSRLMVV